MSRKVNCHVPHMSESRHTRIATYTATHTATQVRLMSRELNSNDYDALLALDQVGGTHTHTHIDYDESE